VTFLLTVDPSDMARLPVEVHLSRRHVTAVTPDLTTPTKQARLPRRPGPP